MNQLAKIILLAAVLGVLASASLAETKIMIREGTGGAVPASQSDRCQTVWCQEPANAYLIESQISQVPEEVVTQVADFVSSTDEAITRIKWWGGIYVQGEGPVEYFVISFFASDGCAGPMGDPIYVREVFAWDEVFQEDYFEYTAELDPVPMDAGETYWLSVQGVLNIDPAGYWGWACGALDLCPAMVTAPSYGVFDWTPVYPDIFPDNPELEERAFCLYTDGAVSSVTASWGTVKALYK